MGPTASGKSALALAIARAGGPDVELVSVDSMQVYRGMDIGTAKPTRAERAEVTHHLLDLVDPNEDFSVARHQLAVRGVLADIANRGRRAILVGGTGLYVRAIVDRLTIPGQWPEVRAELEAATDTPSLHARLGALDPSAAGRIEPGNRRRIIRALEVTIGSGRPFSSFGLGLATYPPDPPFHLVGLSIERKPLFRRIEARFDAMLDDGLLDEVRALAESPLPISRTAGQALGYRELLRHIVDGVRLEDCVTEALQRTRRFARRQQAWFGRDPRITWFDGNDKSGRVAERVLGDWIP